MTPWILLFAGLTLFTLVLAIGAWLTPDDPELDDGELKALERVHKHVGPVMWR